MKAPTHFVNESSGYVDDLDSVIISNGYGGERRDDFAEYMWMEDMESFDKQVLAELEEEEEIEQCMAEMLAEEEARDTTYYTTPANANEAATQRPLEDGLADGLSHLTVEDIVLQSRLNPNAAEFVPSKYGDSHSDVSDSSEASDR